MLLSRTMTLCCFCRFAEPKERTLLPCLMPNAAESLSGHCVLVHDARLSSLCPFCTVAAITARNTLSSQSLREYNAPRAWSAHTVCIHAKLVDNQDAESCVLCQRSPLTLASVSSIAGLSPSMVAHDEVSEQHHALHLCSSCYHLTAPPRRSPAMLPRLFFAPA